MMHDTALTLGVILDSLDESRLCAIEVRDYQASWIHVEVIDCGKLGTFDGMINISGLFFTMQLQLDQSFLH